MCLSPKRIKNRTKYISFSSGSRLVYDVPCGKCSDCIKQKRNDYLLRSHIESKDSLASGGFNYFETLTYKTQPMFNGLPCFSKEDLRKFFKRLHINLLRKGYEITRLLPDGKSFDNLLHHFVTCEYGGRRGRVHYHVLFFSRVPNLTVDTLFHEVRKAWSSKGFNNAPWQYKNNILLNHKAVAYVAKYVEKDSNHLLDLKKQHLRYIALLSELYEKGYTDDDDNVVNVKKLLDVYEDSDRMKSIYPFHMQSNGFGKNIDKYYDVEQIIRTGYVTIVDGLQTFKYSLPIYNQRKLFYEKVTNYNYPDPQTLEPIIQYRLNEDGLRYKMFRVNDSIKKFIDSFFSKIQIIKQTINPQSYVQFKKSLTNLLQGINFRDYALYQLYYRDSLFIGNIQPLELLYKQSQLYKSNNCFAYDEHNNICFSDETGLHKISFNSLLKYSYGQISSYHQRFDNLSTFIENYYRVYSRRKNERFFKNERLKFKIKNSINL